MLKFFRISSDFNREVLKFIKQGSDFNKEVLTFIQKKVKRLSVLDMVVESCSLYEMCLKVVKKT